MRRFGTTRRSKQPPVVFSPFRTSRTSSKTIGHETRSLPVRFIARDDERRICESETIGRRSSSLSLARFARRDSRRRGPRPRGAGGMMCKRNGGDGVSAYTKRGEGDFQSHGNKRKLSRREIVIVYSCVYPPRLDIARSSVHITRALSTLPRGKEKTKKQLELSIRDMIIWLLGDGSPRHTHVSRPHSYSDMIILLGPQPLCIPPFFTFDEKSGFGLSPLSLSLYLSLSHFCSTNTPRHVRPVRRHVDRHDLKLIYFLFLLFYAITRATYFLPLFLTGLDIICVAIRRVYSKIERSSE